MDIAKKFAVIFDAVGMENERDYAEEPVKEEAKTAETEE